MYFAARISEGASYQKIMHEIQNLGTKGGRMHYIKSQDIRNMRKNIINTRNRSILTDIREWVKSAQSSSQNAEPYPIICFKDRNAPDNKKIMSNKDMMLVVMTKFQEETLRAYYGTICIDATHCQEAHEYQLITISVFDNFGCWCPVVYCVLNTVTLETVQYFLTRVKETIGDLSCSVLLSDRDPPFYEAWCSVMPKPQHHMLHLWYVEKDWRENILKIKCSDNVKSMIYKTLKIMLSEENQMSYQSMLTSFLESIQYDARLSEFSAYFLNDYVGHSSEWAGCYRKLRGLTFDYEAKLESLHKTLNKEYHEGIVNQQMRECLTNLIAVSNNCETISRVIMKYCRNVSEDRLQSIQKGHKCGVHVKRTEITEVNGDVFKINSYTIKYLNIDKCECSSTCNICKVCSHEYSCTCTDYATNFNICEHIHACAIIKNKINVDLSAETDEPLDSFVEEVICEEEIICNVENLGEDGDCEDMPIKIDYDDDSVYEADPLDMECGSSTFDRYVFVVMFDLFLRSSEGCLHSKLWKLN